MEKFSNSFVEVILPLAVGDYFTYRLRREMLGRVEVGMRIIVPFGKGGKYYTAIVNSLHNSPPEGYEAKYVEELLDEAPSVVSVNWSFGDG